jgi:multidrug efflux pump subunit AcrA (membrane-fusion protein)
LQAGTRTLLTEIDIDNSAGVLTAGLYGVVRLSIARPQPAIVIPSDAVIFDKSGLCAAVYDGGTIRLHHLDLSADDGSQVEVRGGLKPGDRVVLNPPAQLTDGMRVAAADTPQSIAAGNGAMTRVSADSREPGGSPTSRGSQVKK